MTFESIKAVNAFNRQMYLDVQEDHLVARTKAFRTSDWPAGTLQKVVHYLNSFPFTHNKDALLESVQTYSASSFFQRGYSLEKVEFELLKFLISNFYSLQPPDSQLRALYQIAFKLKGISFNELATVARLLKNTPPEHYEESVKKILFFQAEIGHVLELIGLIPEEEREMDKLLALLSAYHQEKKRFKSEHNIEIKLEPAVEILKLVPPKERSLDVVKSVLKIFSFCQKAPELMKAIDPEDLANTLLHFEPFMDCIQCVQNPEYYLRALSLIPASKHCHDVIFQLKAFVEDFPDDTTLQRTFNIFEKIAPKNRHIELLRKIELLTDNESYSQLLQTPGNGIHWMIETAASLITGYAIKSSEHRSLILKEAHNPDLAKITAENFYRLEQVSIAQSLMDDEDEADTFLHLTKSFIPEIHLYVNHFSNKMFLYYLKNYTPQIAEVAEQIFKQVPLKQKIALITLMLPEQVKRLLSKEDLREISQIAPDELTLFKLLATPTLDTYFPSGIFCLTSMTYPQLIIPHIGQLKYKDLVLFFRFLEPHTLKKQFELYAKQFSALEERSQYLLKKAQAGEDISDPLLQAQTFYESLLKLVEVIQEELKFRTIYPLYDLTKEIKKCSLTLQQADLTNLANIPTEFIDVITKNTMKNPVKLPTQNEWVDLSTLHNPKVFLTEIRDGMVYRQNPTNTLFYPDYTTETNLERRGPGYELDLELRQRISKNYSRHSS